MIVYPEIVSLNDAIRQNNMYHAVDSWACLRAKPCTRNPYYAEDERDYDTDYGDDDDDCDYD